MYVYNYLYIQIYTLMKTQSEKMATFRIESDLWELFGEFCSRYGLNKSAVIRLIIIKVIAGKIKLFDDKYVEQL